MTADRFSSPHLNSYRVPQGVLHNPRSDRRTTQGVFHIAEGGLPVPADKAAVPKQAFAALWSAALRPPRRSAHPALHRRPGRAGPLLRLAAAPPAGLPRCRQPIPRKPWRSASSRRAAWSAISISSRASSATAAIPTCPKTMPAWTSLHWTGHTGCVVLAPHLVGIRKKALGLPHFDDATERQRRDGMCWTDEDELYNDGGAFKVTCRDAPRRDGHDHRRQLFRLLQEGGQDPDQLRGQPLRPCEEEHAGGALAFATYVLGAGFLRRSHRQLEDRRLRRRHAPARRPGGAAARRLRRGSALPDHLLRARDAHFQRPRRFRPLAPAAMANRACPCASATIYVLPSGFRVRLEKQLAGTAWRLVGSRPRGTLCHKPCTVSGGGKSEISKSIADVLLKGPVFVNDYHRDMDQVAEILSRDFSAIYRNRPPDDARPPPHPQRGALARLRHPAADAVRRIHRRAQRLAPPAFRRPSASLSSPSSATTSPSGATTGASTSPSTASTASWATS